MAKFKSKDVILLSKAQVTEGTPIAPAATDAILATEISYKDNISKDTQIYMGDSLSRDEENTITDHYAELVAKFFMPSRGVDTGLTTIADFLWKDWFEAVGGKCSIAGVTPAKIITITNATATSTLLTQQFLASSSEIATQKLYEVYDALGTMDLSIEILKRVMLTFNMKGNYSLPTQETAVTPDYGDRKTLAAAILNSSNIVASELTGLVGGFTHTGDAGTVKNICFTKLDAPNFFGFAVDRLQTSCQTTFDKTAVTTDVTISVLEKEAIALGSESATAYDPYNHLEDIHKFTLKFGLGQGKYVSIYFDQLQLVDISDSKYNNFAAKDLKFRNIGKAQIKLS